MPRDGWDPTGDGGWKRRIRCAPKRKGQYPTELEANADGYYGESRRGCEVPANQVLTVSTTRISRVAGW